MNDNNINGGGPSIPTVSTIALNTKIFTEATNEWQELVTSSRRCKVKFNLLDRFDAIYGPMAANINGIQSAYPHKKPKFQLASKTIESDIYYKSCYAGTIFFPNPTI